MNAISFTKNVNPTTRKNGEWLLGYYFRESKLSKAPYYPVTNFPGLLTYLDTNYPTFVESLGDDLSSIPSDKLIQAMKDAAALGLTSYPRPSTFSNAIIKNTGVSITEIAGDTAIEIGKSIVDFASLFSKTVLIAALVGAAVFVYRETGGKLPELGKLFKGLKKV